MRTDHSILLLACVAVMSGCGDSDAPRKEGSSSPQPAKSVSSPKPIDIPSPPSPAPPQPMQIQTPETIDQLADKAQGARVGSSGRASIVAMHELLKQWSPVGRKTSDVKQMLGKPSEEDQAKLVYRFDDGDQGYEWTMKKDGDSIASMSKVLHE